MDSGIVSTVDAGASGLSPIFLLADSQLLFWKGPGGLFLDRVRVAAEAAGATPGKVKAAYLGASNGDVRDFYELFVGAMEGIGARDTRMIVAEPSARDRAFLEAAEVILLAGGDPTTGWRAFQAAGLDQRLVARYAAGAVLIGISAGAMQLGQRGWSRGGKGSFEALRLVPLLVDVHDEPHWVELGERVAAAAEHGRGLGIPLGGGAVIHADLSVEPVRRPLIELDVVDAELRRSVLLPPGEAP